MKIRWLDELDEDRNATLGKFVLIGHGEDYWFIRSSPKICEYHAQIVERYAQRHGIPVRLNSDRSDLARAPEGLRILGGGYWEQLDDGRMRFFAKSAAFGRFDEDLIQGLGFDRDLQWFIEPL